MDNRTFPFWELSGRQPKKIYRGSTRIDANEERSESVRDPAVQPVGMKNDDGETRSSIALDVPGAKRARQMVEKNPGPVKAPEILLKLKRY